MKKHLLIFLNILLIGCSQNSNTLNKNNQVNSNFLMDSVFNNFSGNYNFTDDGSFWLLYFKNGNIAFDFGPNRGHEFLAKKINNRKIIFYFDNKRTCGYDKDFELKFKGIKSPIVGKPFGELSIISDSTLSIKYYYQDWVNNINAINYEYIDTLFPKNFKRINFTE